MSRDELIAWLNEGGHADEVRGYGHRCSEDLADALLEAFTMEWRRRDP